MFGSPFLKNASIICGLVVGMIVAGATGYVDGSSIKTARSITFFWVETFPLSVDPYRLRLSKLMQFVCNSKIYAPAILPMLAVYIALTMEVMGDIVASSEASREPIDGLLLDSRIAGGILADGFNGMLSALFTNAPLSIFAQNNGGKPTQAKLALADPR